MSERHWCTFCGKSSAEVQCLILGPTPAQKICSECVELCADLIARRMTPVIVAETIGWTWPIPA
jgi:ATP-dependent protease Clp ATPase subunit